MSSASARLEALRDSDPEQFRKLMLELKAITLQPHSGQQKVIASDARFRVMNCGRRWGKTKLAAHILVKKARKKKQMLWWVAPTYKVVKRGYAEVLAQLPDGVLTHEPPPDTNFDAGRSVILRFKNGTRMEFYSAERPEGMLGAGVDFAILDEAAIMPARIWNQIVRPTLMDRKGGAIMISTPRGRNWFYKVWQQGQDPQQPDYASWTFQSWTNPTLPDGEVEAMKASMPRTEYEQEVEAKFLAVGSSVFLLHDRAIQPSKILDTGMVEGVPPKGYVSLGIDLARTNDWTVLYGERMHDRRNCYFERMQAIAWPEQKRRIRRAVAELRKAGAENVMLMVDSTGVGDPIAEDLEADGYDVVGINFSTHKANMVRLLAKNLEDAQAYVLEDGMISEFENYAMSVTPSGKFTYSAPEGEHDDVVAAKMLAHWGTVNEGVGAVSVISSGSLPSENSDPRTANQESDTNDTDGSESADFDLAVYDAEEGEKGQVWDDLIDVEEDMSDEDAMAAIGIDAPRAMTPAELLASPDVWRS
jgi:Terminase large subunit, T4likevirus-type, N-terminal